MPFDICRVKRPGTCSFEDRCPLLGSAANNSDNGDLEQRLREASQVPLAAAIERAGGASLVILNTITMLNDRSSRPLPDPVMESRAERTADTRERIERAALKHFVEQGIAATSIRDIANTARIALGALYNHFPSKEDLAWHLFISGWTGIGRELRDHAHEPGSLAEKLRSMIGCVFRRFDEDWLLVTYVFLSRHHHLKRVPPTRDNPYLIFRLVIAEAMRRQEIPRENLELKTSLVIGAIIQATDSRILERLKGSLNDYVDAAARCCMQMLE